VPQKTPTFPGYIPSVEALKSSMGATADEASKAYWADLRERYPSADFSTYVHPDTDATFTAMTLTRKNGEESYDSPALFFSAYSAGDWTKMHATWVSGVHFMGGRNPPSVTVDVTRKPPLAKVRSFDEKSEGIVEAQLLPFREEDRKGPHKRKKQWVPDWVRMASHNPLVCAIAGAVVGALVSALVPYPWK
jgi:hypothetical protein